MTAVDPQPGDWVLVRAKVVELHPNGRDLGLELFSKTDQYTVFVRGDLCEPCEKPIPDEPGDRSVAMVAGTAYQRLAGGYWFAAGVVMEDPDSFAFHGRTWADLNRFGDVEVIHHA